MPQGATTETTPTTTAVPAPSTSVAPAASPAASPSTVAGTTTAPASPTTALEALERAAAAADVPASTPSTTVPAGSGSPAPSTRAATSPAASTVPPRPTDAPDSRIEAAVKNTRDTLEQELGWARQYGSREEVAHATAMVKRLSTPEGARAFVKQLQSEIIEQYGDDTPPAEDADPEPDLISSDGTKKAFSVEANKKYVDVAVKRALRDLTNSAEYKAAVEYARKGEAVAKNEALKAEASATASEVLATIGKLPHFQEHKAEIGAVLAAIPVETRRQVGSTAALYMAYTKVLAEKVLPTLGNVAQTEAQTIANLQRSAAAGNASVAPGPTVPARPVIRDGNVDDLAKHLEKKFAEMST